MPSIDPAVARLLKTEDVQKLLANDLPVKAGSNGDIQDDTTHVLSAMMIADDIFRRINVPALGNAQVIGIGDAITANSPTTYESLNDNLAEFAATVEIAEFIVDKMSIPNDQQKMQEGGKCTAIRLLYGREAFEGTGAMPSGSSFPGINLRTPAGQRAAALVGSPSLFLSNLDRGLRRTWGNVCIFMHPLAAEFLANQALIANDAKWEWVYLPGIGMRPRYREVQIYFANLTEFDDGTSNIYHVAKDYVRILVSSRAPAVQIDEVKDPTADLTRKRVTWNAGLTILGEKYTFVTENVPHGPLA